MKVLETFKKNKIGGVDGGEDPPVPIPNTEVKLTSVDNTWLETAWEDRAVPVQDKKPVTGFFEIGRASCRERV